MSVQKKETVFTEKTGFLPHELVLLSLVFFAASVLVIFLGTSVLRLPGIRTLPTSVKVAKSLLGIFLMSISIGLYFLVPLARKAAMALLALAIFAPLAPLQNKYIDWEFLVVLMALVSLASALLLGYLYRKSTAFIFERGGLPVRLDGYYCGSCGYQTKEPPSSAGCSQCGGPVFSVLKAPGGSTFAKRA